mmetsp:Transcript_46406/g.129112  ORF Transcript_46406/g.129112 Transcript_46406/m.129112 type:complete len:204 (-) Transcript_46406:236-847(-)
MNGTGVARWSHGNVDGRRGGPRNCAGGGDHVCGRWHAWTACRLHASGDRRPEWHGCRRWHCGGRCCGEGRCQVPISSCHCRSGSRCNRCHDLGGDGRRSRNCHDASCANRSHGLHRGIGGDRSNVCLLCGPNCGGRSWRRKRSSHWRNWTWSRSGCHTDMRDLHVRDGCCGANAKRRASRRNTGRPGRLHSVRWRPLSGGGSW